jgi:hypothetical protein
MGFDEASTKHTKKGTGRKLSYRTKEFYNSVRVKNIEEIAVAVLHNQLQTKKEA